MSLKKSEIDTMIEVMDKNIKDSTLELAHLLEAISNSAKDALEYLGTAGTVRHATVIDPILTTRANSLSLRIATATDVRASLRRARADAV